VREHLVSRVEREKIDRVKLLPPQPRHRIPAILASADAAIITLGMTLPGAVPSKIYEAMAASLPIIIVADGEPVDRVLAAECGIGVPPNDIDALETAVVRLIREPVLRTKLGSAGRHAAETTYDRGKIAGVLSEFLKQV
jgi:glycosyltransferase involved in cell wall biosynthesis